ncbi:putative ribosomal protein L30, bacterial-type [Helianthus debilis subsp. tardiflorus]
MRWNTPTVRGMLQQVVFRSCVCVVVKRLVVIETEDMFKARKEKEAKHRAIRPPLVVSHLIPPANESSQQTA